MYNNNHPLMFDAFNATKKYGLVHPLLKSSDNSEDSSLSDTQRENQNYITRINAMQEPTPAPEQNKNVFLEALSLLDRPRAAVWTGIHDAATGGNFLEGARAGITGERNYSGAQLMKDLGVQNETAQGIAGFAAELIGDPLNLVTFGTGSLAKGAITGTAKALTREGAEIATRAALKDITSSSAREAAVKALSEEAKAAGKPITKYINAAGVEQKSIEHAYNKANELLSQHGTQIITPMTAFKSVDGVLNHAEAMLTGAMMDNAERTAGKGLSVGIGDKRVTLISDDKMRKAGADAANFVKDKVPVVGGLLDSAQDLGRKMFDPKYVNGLDDVKADAIYKFKRAAYGEKNIADAASMEKFDRFTKALGDLGIDEGKRQDQLLYKVMEGTASIDDLHESIRGIAKEMDLDVNRWFKKESEAGLLSSKKDKYFPKIPSWELNEKTMRRAGMTENIKTVNPSNFKSESGDNLFLSNKYMKYKTSTDSMKHLFADNVADLLGRDKGSKISAYDIKSAYEKGGDDIFNVLDGEDNFFEVGATKAWLSRELEHNRIIADKSITDNIMAGLGERVENATQAEAAQANGQQVVVLKSAMSLYRIAAKDSIQIASELKNARNLEKALEKLAKKQNATTAKAAEFASGADEAGQAAGARAGAAEVKLGNGTWNFKEGKKTQRIPIQVEQVVDKDGVQMAKLKGYDTLVPYNEISMDTAKYADDQATIDLLNAKIEKLHPQVAAVAKKLMTQTPEAFAVLDPKEFDIMQKYLPELFHGKNTALFGRQNLIEAYAVPPGVVTALRDGIHKQTNAGLDALGKSIDKVMSIWKPTVTGLNPGYHIRNAVGSTYQNMINVGMKTFDPNIQSMAAKLATGKDGTIELAGQTFSAKELQDALLRTHANTNLQINEFMDKASAMQNRYDANIGAGNSANPVAKAVKGAVGEVKSINSVGRAVEVGADFLKKPGEIVGKGIETHTRSVNFLANMEDGLEKGMTKEQAIQYAGEQTNKFHFDYSELSKTEKNVLRRIFPFYTWARKNIPLQMEQFLNNPAAYTAIPKYQRNMQEAYGEDTSNMPTWFRNAMPLPLPTGGNDAEGNQAYANISTPQADLANITQDPLKYGIGMLSPLAKVPFEISQNRSLLTGAPLWDNNYDKGGAIGNEIANQFGILRDIKKIREGDDSTPTGAVRDALPDGIPGGSIIKDYNTPAAQATADYAYKRQLGNEIQHLKKVYGEDAVPTVKEAELWNKLSPEVIESIKRTGVIPPYLQSQSRTAVVEVDNTPNYSPGYRERYLNKLTESNKNVTLKKALNAALYKNGGL